MAESITLQFLGVFFLSITIAKNAKAVFGISLPTHVKSTILTGGWLCISLSIYLLLLFSNNTSIDFVIWVVLLSFEVLFVAIAYCLRE